MEKTPIALRSLDELTNLARDLRLDVLEMTTRAKSGHPSSCFSAVEILTALYFGGILRYRPQEPWWEERDRFILSKGHAAPLLYAVLARTGYFPYDMLWSLRQLDSPLQGHPVQGFLPGVEATTGSLGQGLSVGLGHALAGKMRRLFYRVYVLLGDGECQEGQVWEAAMAASHFKAGNLTAIVDYNKFQETGPIAREMNLEPFRAKWEGFGWFVEEVDGHDIESLLEKLGRLRMVQDRPSVLIAHTVKGKGVSFVENDYTFHGRALTEDQAKLARRELQCE
ncbi:MAG: transketolase [Atribacterota bacterium]